RPGQKEITVAASRSSKKRRSSRLCLPGIDDGAPNPRRLRRPESTLVLYASGSAVLLGAMRRAIPFKASGVRLRPEPPVRASLAAEQIKLEYRLAVCLGNAGTALFIMGDNLFQPLINNSGTGLPPLPGATAVVNSYRESKKASPRDLLDLPAHHRRSVSQRT